MSAPTLSNYYQNDFQEISCNQKFLTKSRSKTMLRFLVEYKFLNKHF